VVLFALVVALVVSSFGGAKQVDRSAAPSTASTATTTPNPTRGAGKAPSTTAGSTTPPSTVPHTAAFDATIRQLETFVEKERGLKFKKPVDVAVVGDSDFERMLLKDFDEGAKDRADAEAVLGALGLIPPGTDLDKEVRDLLSVGVVGFYDPETKQLAVRGTELTPYAKQTIAHELTHALDDQWFDLNRKALDDKPDESSFGFSALVEGNARRVEDAYTNSLPADQRQRLDDESNGYSAQISPRLAGIPDILLQMIVAPYDLGEPFTQFLMAHGGQSRLDAAFAKPPVTSEQVMDPAKYLAGEQRVPVATPPAGGRVIDQGVMGQLMLGLLLNDSVGTTQAARDAAGWGGDWYVAWRSGTGTCLRFDVVMDTPKDLAELAEGLHTWAASQGSAQVESHGSGLRVTSCSAAQSSSHA
jgi:hypothetical protein